MGEPSSRYIESPEEIEAGLEQLKAELIEHIEPAYRDRFRELIGLTDAFCREHLKPLEAEFVLCCRLLAAACCQEGTPIVESRVKAKTWAAAIVYTIGWVNFLSDPSFEPFMSSEDMAAAFRLSVGTMQRRSVEIREGLEIIPSDPNWTLPSRMSENPLIWLVEDENGVVVDIRTRPREEQVKAFEAGVIPYVPEEPDESMPFGLSPEAFARLYEELEREERGEGIEDIDPQELDPDMDDPDNPVIGRIGPDGPEQP
jgi:hypothetical protein